MGDDKKKRCEWCEKEIDDSQFTAYGQGFVVMKRLTIPYYFDAKGCLLNWVMGLVKSEDVR